MARMMADTVPITEKNPFTPQANATNLFSDGSIKDIPIGKGIPIKNPSGKIINAETRILQCSSKLTSELKIYGFKIPIANVSNAIILKII